MVQDGSAGAPHFTVGGVISTSLAVFGRNIVPFFLLALVIGIPYILVTIGVAGNLDIAAIEQTGQLPDGFWGIVAIGFLIALLTFVLTQSVIIFGTVQDLRGRKASFGESLSRGLAALPRVLIAAILATIAIFIGMMLLLVPGFILAVMWWVLVPVIVIEGAGVGQSFGRSAALTKGHRWGILGLVLIVAVAQWAVGLVVGLLAAALGQLAGEILNTIVMFIFTSFAGVLAAVAYYFLRAEKEGVMIDDIARVFD